MAILLLVFVTEMPAIAGVSPALVMLTWFAVMPFCASAMTRSQFTAARSAGLRATFARNRAR